MTVIAPIDQTELLLWLDVCLSSAGASAQAYLIVRNIAFLSIGIDDTGVFRTPWVLLRG